jgi:S-adenosylmethionine decarboxylase
MSPPYEFIGTHVIADIRNIDDHTIRDDTYLLTAVAAGIHRSGATICGMQTKHFDPAGLTAVYLLAESHVSIHTYPEHGSLFFDAFTCGEGCDPLGILDELLDALGPCEPRTRVMPRGCVTIPAAALTGGRHLDLEVPTPCT